MQTPPQMVVRASLPQTFSTGDDLGMARPPRVPQLTDSELRLLPLLTTPLSFSEIGRLLGVPRDEIQAEAVSIYAKLGIALQQQRRADAEGS